MKLKIKRINFEPNRRIICISDIHGGYQLFCDLLKKVNYCSDDYLVIIGDILEKGPESLKTLRYIMELAKNKSVYILMGNNDQIVYDIYYNRFVDKMYDYTNRCKSIYHDFCFELGITITKNTDFEELNKILKNKYQSEFDFVMSFPTIIESENLLFAHASITDYNNMEKLSPCEVIRYDHFMRDDFYLPKRLVVGHYPSIAYNYGSCSLKVATDYKKNISSIDGGYSVKIGGQLNALVFNNEKELKEEYYFVDDIKKVEVKKDVEGIKAKNQCIWDREDFSLIEKYENESLCLINNNKCIIPNDFIYLYQGRYCCGDYTDEILPLKKGEEVGLIKVFTNKAFIKKGDVIGFTYLDAIKLKDENY